ncbi:hypothetical protein K450DRAFT_171197 [Umbelopsis ramanniana AG]|uniref:Class II aldolase/adducin N-terminal domain-containing protein n=1 Tax=Umbelopsis ramanniana AG TaxID=1314678 RepID=A0AAD5EEZ7_UMBRA|nr:uncharacterized protein K450DRAFT_171197 [Umbelopsis ramanniana AG]KAI8582202.1 hypothetical protein K450DRAFT_171197 [Umbelopsis ramanniana AG]
MAADRSVFLRSKVKIVLTGSETKEEAEAALRAPINIPRYPHFNDVHEQRVHMKQKLAAGFRLFAKFGWDEGVAGHMTFRDPEYPELYWVNYFGQSFSQVRASDLVLCDHSGAIVRGNQTVNKAAFVIHSAIHEGRPDATCAVHAHSMYGKTFSALGRKLLPITQDSCAFYEDHSLYDDFGGVVYTPEEGERLKSALGQSKAMILKNHGLLTVGSSVDEAIWWFISMERCCMSQLIAEAACTNGFEGLKLIDHDVALGTRSNVGDKQAGFFQFQPMFAQIVKEQPDLLD